MRILVVDDEPTTLKTVAAFLDSVPEYTAVQANNGEEAMEQLGLRDAGATGNDIKLVITDYKMPGIDGVELCSLIRSEKELADTQVIMMTTYDEMDNMQSAYANGVIDFIAKPINRGELLSRVQLALKAMANEK